VADQAVLVGTNRPTKGPAEAVVTVVEFSDLQCPACRSVEPLVSSLSQQYPDKVRVIYRHFPLVNIHKYALLASHASMAAASEGKFWEFHDKLFDTQTDWSALSSEDEVKNKFVEYAQELGIDKAVFLEKIDSDAIKQVVAEDLAVATQLKVDSTPTFYVNGRKLTAPQQLMPAVESLLK
jgi:protein-disulfide isomerase